jgi:class I fructose-bisphosphate aldolase
MSIDYSKIQEFLGDESETLLGHVSKTISKSDLHLPGPDFIDRVWLYSDRTPAVLRSLQTLTNTGRLGGTGYLSILPVDQGIEHSGGASFAPNPQYFDPENIVKLAIEGGCNAVASTFGVLGSVARKFAHKIPFIVKINHNELMTFPNKFDQVMFGTIDQARDMGALAVGATIYFGSDESTRQITEVSEAFAYAHELGMATILWCYLRNPKFKTKEGDFHAAADLTGQANHLGVTIQADIIKQKLPTNNGGYNVLNTESSYGKTSPKIYTDLTSDNPIDLVRYQVANCYMGRCGLINSGGESKGSSDLADAVRTAVVNKRGGGTGLISGRKAFQRPMSEGVELLNSIQDVYLCQGDHRSVATVFGLGPWSLVLGPWSLVLALDLDARAKRQGPRTKTERPKTVFLLLLRITPMDRLDPKIRLNKSASPLFVLLRQPRLFDLVERLSFLHLGLHQGRRFDQRLVISLEVVKRGQRTVTGDKLCRRRDLAYQLAYVRDHSLHAATAVDIHERKSADEKVITEMDDVRVLEEHDRVAVGVTVREVHETDVLAIEVDRHALRVSHDGKRERRVEFRLLSEERRWIKKSLPHIHVRDDRRVLSEVLVTFRVIAMPVRVEYEPRFLRPEHLQRFSELWTHGFVIVVDDQNSIHADDRTDISSATLKHVDVPGNVCRLYLNVLLFFRMTVVTVSHDLCRHERQHAQSRQ